MFELGGLCLTINCSFPKNPRAEFLSLVLFCQSVSQSLSGNITMKAFCNNAFTFIRCLCDLYNTHSRTQQFATERPWVAQTRSSEACWASMSHSRTVWEAVDITERPFDSCCFRALTVKLSVGWFDCHQKCVPWLAFVINNEQLDTALTP